MKKISLKKLQFNDENSLSREQLKDVMGGSGPTSTNEYAKACDGKSPNADCKVGNKEGTCKYGLTGPLVCFV